MFIKKLTVGIDIGGTDIKYGIFYSNADSIYENQVSTPENSTYKQLLDVLSTIVDDVIKNTNSSWDQIESIGVGVPGFIDYKKNIVLHMPNMGYKNVPMKLDLETRWQKPVFIDNDANLAALGESWVGGGRESSHSIGITIGTGIGSGIIIDGTIYHGSIGLAGEIGHVSIDNSKLRQCGCGKIGCLETEVSTRAISLHAVEIAERQQQGALKKRYEETGTIDTRFVIEQAKIGNQDCITILALAGSILGKALANVATVLNPEKILIGGGIANAGDLLLEPIKKAFTKHTTPLIAMNTLISLAELGNRAGIIGAAKLAINNTNR